MTTILDVSQKQPAESFLLLAENLLRHSCHLLACVCILQHGREHNREAKTSVQNYHGTALLPADSLENNNALQRKLSCSMSATSLRSSETRAVLQLTPTEYCAPINLSMLPKNFPSCSWEPLPCCGRAAAWGRAAPSRARNA